MTWTIETDAEAAARQRTGAIDGRYQVCHPVEGFIEAVDTLGDAFRVGDHYASRKLRDGSPYCSTPYEVEVYDRMARRGQPRTWRRTERKTYCMEHGDKLTQTAVWKCIRRVGCPDPPLDDLTGRLWA